MKFKVDLTKNNYLESIVALTSLCINNPLHIDLMLLKGNLNDEINIIRNSLSQYDITFKDGEVNEDDFILFPTNVIIDGDISRIIDEIENGNDSKPLLSFAIDAQQAHEKGMNYNDVKGNYEIIYFPTDRPWQCTNIHYDIEKIWWEYAKKTPIYKILMEIFLDSALFDTSLEDYANFLCEDNKKLIIVINEAKDTLQKLVR